MVQAAASKNRQAVHKASETAEVGELPSGVKSCLLQQLFLSAAEDQLADSERGCGDQNQLPGLGDAVAVAHCGQ